MPKNRIPLAYTNENKLKAVEEQLASATTRSAWCGDAGIPRTTHLTWARKREKLKIACETRPKARTLGGGGRKSASHPIEDALVGWIKDQRREELPVSRDAIVRQCIRLLPSFLAEKTEGARLAWCDRFLDRYDLTIRRISHSGRKKKEELIKYREAFALEVSTVLITHFLDAATALPPPYVLYNMDQTSVYCHLGARTTVDFVGVKRVPCSLAGKGGYRCTVALTACADGLLLPPHFVFKGKLGGDVEEEVTSFCDPDTATCAVQSNAWFDEATMLDWIEQVWRHEVTGPSVLILDSLKVHKCDAVKDALTGMGTYPLYVPGGTTSVSQPLDVGIMGPFKTRLRRLYVEMYTGVSPPMTAFERRRDMVIRTLTAVKEISSETVVSSFRAAGPFLPMGPTPPGIGDIIDGVEALV